MIDLLTLFINMLYIVIGLFVIGWVGILLVKIIKPSIPKGHSKGQVLKYIKDTAGIFATNIYTLIGSLSILVLLIWFNMPQPLIPRNINANEAIPISIRVQALKNTDLVPYDSREFSIDKPGDIGRLLEILNQYTCRRSSEYPDSMLVNQGLIEISMYQLDNHENIQSLHIAVTPGFEEQSRRYSYNDGFIYTIKQTREQSLSQDLINYLGTLE